MGNRCCSLCSLSENEDMKDISDVIEMALDVGQIDQLISSIEEGLNTLERRLQENNSTSTQGIASSPPLQLGKYLLEKWSKRVDRQGCMMCCMSKLSRETKLVAEVLKEVADIHWLVGGLSLVAYVMDQIDQVSQNKTQCVRLLRRSCALAKKIKQLDRHLPQEKDELNDAIQLIVKGSLMCLSQMQSHEFSRFVYASMDVGDLQDFENQMDRAYPDLILTAVTAVLNQTSNLPPSQGDYPNAVGIEEARKHVTELLSLDAIDQTRRAVVIYGVGGVGKTTLATAVFNKLDLKGYKFCRLFMDENCSPQHLKQLQQQILDDLFAKKNALRDSVEGQEELRKAFGEAKEPLLMFIDNALRGADLEQLLLADLSCMSQQMRILVTTRKLDQTDFLQQHIQRYEHNVNFLSSADSKKILCKMALGNVDASFPEGLNVDEAVDMCGGIPLVLELVGSKIRKSVDNVSDCNRLLRDMKQMLEKGERIVERDMSDKVVDFVYNSLNGDCKESFLDISCFFHKKPRRIVAYIVGNAQLQVLEDAALVKVFPDSEVSDMDDEGDEYIQAADAKEGIIKVHDVVRARGRCLSESKRITDMQSLSEAIEDQQKAPEIKGIWLPDSTDGNALELQAEQVDRMHKSLRVLNLHHSIQLKGRCRRNFENLRFLNFGIHTFPIAMDLSKAKQLAYLNCAIESPCTVNDVPELPVSLNFLRCESEHPINVFDKWLNLSSLEELQFRQYEHNLSESFGNLQSLRFLSFEDSRFATLPERFGQLTRLSVLNLSGCSELVSLPANFGQLKLLSGLNLSGCSKLITLPQSFGNLCALKSLDLDLDYCSQLTTLPESFGNFRALESLSLRRWPQLTTLPESFGNLCALKTLHLGRCPQLTTLPESFGNLCALESLDLGSCSQLTTLPEIFGNLCALNSLDLRSCSQLTTLPESFGNLCALKSLDLRSCSQLTALPESFGNLSALKTLHLTNCSQLTTLPESLGNLCALKTLHLGQCSQLTTLPESFGKLCALKSLDLRSCSQLTTLPESFGNLCALESLDLDNCSQLTTLPESFGNLCALNRLYLNNCSQLTTLPESFGNLCALKSLYLSNCSQLTTLPESFGNLSALEILYLTNCSQLTTLPESFGNLSALKILALEKCSNLTGLPESSSQLSNLKELDMQGCEKVSNLPDKFGQLKSLESLSIESCTAMERLPSDFGGLISLTHLNAKCCSQLVGEAIDALVEMKNSVVLEINESPLMIQPRKLKQLTEHHVLIVVCESWERACSETECTALSHSASRFLHVNDDEQVADWQPCEFAGGDVKWALLFTMCDLSQTSNIRVKWALLHITYLKYSGFNFMYVVVGGLKDESEERIRGTLPQFWRGINEDEDEPSLVCAWIPPYEVSIEPTAPCWFASSVF